ncbi:hypothetical protein [Streptomyces xanthophaeus]|uniref:hypothetical protein n=1 Tax=Streptomyces xanthophaeus TaxID=67385 RepID=UPI0004CDD5C4|nr:hypothetical protein [Streptomyces xanthophaeus]
MSDLSHDVPRGLSELSARYLTAHAIRTQRRDVEPYRAQWLSQGVPAEVIDRAAQHEARWGGLVLPPAPFYEGGPLVLSVDVPEGSAEQGWWFPAGDQRTSVAFGFLIGPHGEFGLRGVRRVPLHSSIEGWVESLALAHHARLWATRVTTVWGTAVEDLDLHGLEPVQCVGGLADTWWRGPHSLVAVYRGEADAFGTPTALRAHVYEGLPEESFWFDRPAF